MAIRKGCRHPNPKPLAERFLEKVVIGGGCWGWRGAVNGDGYGQIYGGPTPLLDRAIGAHRASWMIHNGDIPDGMQVLHKCDNPICTNPDHLFLGNQLANIADRDAKGRCGRNGGQHGVAHHHAKLNPVIVADIRAAYKAGVRQSALSAQYGISQSHVSRLVRGEQWAVAA